jgi:outer membrane protein assembly factor BamB
MRLWIGLVGSVFFIESAMAVETNWLQFRGPSASSYSATANPPTGFSASEGKNIAWKVTLPGRSAAGAIVVGDQVITTSSTGVDQRRIHVAGYSAADGKKRWEQSFVARGRPFCHPYSCNAAPTPASDGRHVFAFYSSNDIVCLDLEGKLVWYRSLASEFPKAGNDTGMSSSPLVIDDVVIVQVECQGDSFAAGLDTATGELLWKKERPHAANWSSPAPAIVGQGKTVAVFTSRQDVSGLNPKTGEVVFQTDLSASTISSALAVDGKLLIASSGLTALDLTKIDDTMNPAKLWNNNKLEPGNSSPIVVGDKVVLVKGSVLTVGTLDDGKLLYKTRLPDAGSIWSTPIVCGNRLYVFNDKGTCFLVQIGTESAEILGTGELGEMVLGSPAVVGDSLYVRSDQSLWKISG